MYTNLLFLEEKKWNKSESMYLDMDYAPERE